VQNQGLMLKNTPGQPRKQDPSKNQKRDPKIRPRQEIETVQTDLGSWLTRNDAADLLRRSVTTIANYERDGRLHPRHVYRADSRGIEHRVAVYDPKELMPLRNPELRSHATRDPGEIAARSFELFNQGKTVCDVVIELRETPDQVRQLHESWLDSGGADLTITPVAKEALEKVVGPFATVADLLSVLEEIAKRSGAHETSM
jgi:hypothetical protein